MKRRNGEVNENTDRGRKKKVPQKWMTECNKKGIESRKKAKKEGFFTYYIKFRKE